MGLIKYGNYTQILKNGVRFTETEAAKLDWDLNPVHDSVKSENEIQKPTHNIADLVFSIYEVVK